MKIECVECGRDMGEIKGKIKNGLVAAFFVCAKCYEEMKNNKGYILDDDFPRI